MSEKYTYHDRDTGKLRFTRGTFVGWTPATGLLEAQYAIFRTPSTDVMVPEYLLTKETKEKING